MGPIALLTYFPLRGVTEIGLQFADILFANVRNQHIPPDRMQLMSMLLAPSTESAQKGTATCRR